MIPDILSVSQVVATTGCFLKALKHGKGNDEDQLCPHPSAELGKIYHLLLEKAVRGITNGEDITIAYLEDLFDLIVEDNRKRLERDPRTEDYANLKRTVTPLVWERKRRAFVDTVFDLIKKALTVESSTKKEKKSGFCFEDARGDGCWSEVPICVPKLRLKGRIDLLKRASNEIKIVDLKSGAVLDANGEIKVNISLQLLIYGIMAQTIDPGACISLSINDGTEHSISFDPNTVRQTEKWLNATMSSLVPGACVLAEEYATVCQECRWCGIRHRCERYLREAPNLWTRVIDWRLPMDVWGTLEAMTFKGNGLVDLTLMDAGGRRVKVFNVKELNLKDVIVGERLWIFDMVSSKSSLRTNSLLHPLNFYEICESDLGDRAWSMQIFVG